MKLTIHTDGSCVLHKQRIKSQGGWGFIAHAHNFSYQSRGGVTGVAATNQRMEMLAIIHAFMWAYAAFGRCEILLISDSEYCINTATKWRHIRERECFRGSANIDLIKALYRYSDLHKVSYSWVKGHSKDFYNDIADKLAREGRESITLGD